jgi:hypothetical protein
MTNKFSLKLVKFFGLAIATVIVVVAIAFHQLAAQKAPDSRLRETTLSGQSAVIERSLFGMHIAEPFSNLWPEGVASWRLWDTSSSAGLPFWPHLERHKGEWDFRTLDDCVQLAQEKGVDLIYVMGLTPKWAAARPDDSSPYGDGPTPSEPKDLEDWRNYVRTVATRYKGKIRYYEIWNEPNLKNFYTGTLDQMLVLAREAYTILKEVDPAIQVISPSVIAGDYGWLVKGGAAWLDEYFSKGGDAYTDIVGAHFYQQQHDLPPEAAIPQIQQIQAVMKKHGLEKKPLWNTETGFGDKGQNIFFSEEDSAAYVARAYILNWALGIPRYYWYAWDNRNVVTILLVEKDGKTLTAAGKAYGEVQKWLVGSRLEGCDRDGDETWMCQLTKEGGDRAWIVWNPKREITLEVPRSFGVRHVSDLTGKESLLSLQNRLKVGKMPVLLSAK